ncbi:MAG TPA: lamin tail domain-containing protein [Rudaea sp.]|nr:lamin tail domain-containing protein [Rudaea sp.]
MQRKGICILLGIVALAGAAAADAQVVISQVYGGGGNSGATYKNDFIELFNAGSTAQDLTGWSVQYSGATNSSWTGVTNLTSVTLQPGEYYLIQEAAGAGGTTSLPTADATGSINMSATNGKVALVNSTTTLPTGCPAAGSVVDLVGFGTGSAMCSETAPVAALTNTTAALRNNSGCTDSGNNSSDFSTGAPAPRNTATALNVCGGGTPPSGTGNAAPAVAQTSGTAVLTVAVTGGSSPASTGLAVTADMTPIGGSATQTFYDDGTNGDATGGDLTFTYAATIGAATAAGNKTITATISDSQGRHGSATISLLVTGTPVSIMSIQGHGTSSPMAGTTVTMVGNIVTALKSNGFFMQDPVGDGDLTTSDAVFVFTSAAPTVHVGDSVTVVGNVQEFGGSTEISSPAIHVDSTGNALPAAYVIDSNPPSRDPTQGICMGAGSTINLANAATDGYQASNFACLDGMRVTINTAVVTGATFASGADGVHTGNPQGLYAMVDTGQALPFRSAGALYPGFGGSIPVFDGEPEVIELYFPGLPAFNPASAVFNAGTTFSVTGVMQGFKSSTAPAPIYELYPASVTPIDVVDANSLLHPVADSAPGTLTIGSQNLLHFFNDTADGQDTSTFNDTCAGTGASDTCPTHAEYLARLDKWTRVICDELKAPAVLDLEEIENLSVARDLAANIATFPPGGIGCGVSYQPYVIPGNDLSGINIGLLVREDVGVESVTQMYKGTQTNNCSGATPCLLNDRPPVLLRASYNGYRFALLAIYDRSLSGLGDPTKPYIGPKRAEQAAQIASIVQAFQSGATLTGAGNARQDATGAIATGPFDIVGDATVPLVVAGDFNAYEFTDGYADVTGMIMGTAVQSQNQYWYTGDAANTDTPNYAAPVPTLVDSGVAADPGQRYSYNFSGLKQEIDHIVLSRLAWKDFVSIGNVHGNSDVSEADPAALDGSTPARSGDHDGQVVTIAIDRIFADGYEAQP